MPKPLTRILALIAVLSLAAACSGGESETAGTTTTPAGAEPSETTTTTEAPMEAGHRAYVYTPNVGDCFDRRRLEPDEGGGLVVLLLDCGLPHTYEVYAVFQVDDAHMDEDGNEEPPGFPGEDALEDEARRICPTHFEEWVGLAYELSELEIGWVLPTEEAWNSGDRTAACTVYDPSQERVTGSQQQAER